MGIKVCINGRSARRIVSQLDMLAANICDGKILCQIIAMRKELLESRNASFATKWNDRKIIRVIAQIRRMISRAGTTDAVLDLFCVLYEYIAARELKTVSGASDNLRLIVHTNSLEMHLHLLEDRMKVMESCVDGGMRCEEMLTIVRKYNMVRAEVRQNLAAIRAINDVELLKYEGAHLKELQRMVDTMLPTETQMEESVVYNQVLRQALDARFDACKSELII